MTEKKINAERTRIRTRREKKEDTKRIGRIIKNKGIIKNKQNNKE